MSKLLTSFTNLSDTAFLNKAELITASLTGNPNFPEPWPAPVPGTATLATVFGAYQVAVNATTSGNKTSIASRKATRETLMSTLKSIAYYLMIVAQDDDTMLSTTGYDLSKPVVHATAGTLPAPDDFKLSRGEISGVVMVKAKVLPGAASYQVQTTDGDPTTGHGWQEVGTFAHCTKIQLSGLTPGRNISVRMRAIGSAGPGAWTQAATLMVV